MTKWMYRSKFSEGRGTGKSTAQALNPITPTQTIHLLYDPVRVPSSAPRVGLLFLPPFSFTGFEWNLK